jgi:hypothetical protein
LAVSFVVLGSLGFDDGNAFEVAKGFKAWESHVTVRS